MMWLWRIIWEFFLGKKAVPPEPAKPAPDWRAEHPGRVIGAELRTKYPHGGRAVLTQQEWADFCEYCFPGSSHARKLTFDTMLSPAGDIILIYHE